MPPGWWAWLALAFGAPRIAIEAEVDPDLSVIRGRAVVEDLDDAVFVDPLAGMPVPRDELGRVRTWPGRSERGRVVWERRGDTLVFEAHLPRRWEDIGHSAHGLFANGGWYPQPLVDGRMPLVDWDVHLGVPADTLAVVGDATGARAARWNGRADRVSIAVVPKGRVTVIEGDGFRVRLVTKGRPRRALVRNLVEELPVAVVSGRVWEGTVVEAPLQRRLSRAGADLAYVSHRAWRVFPLFYRLHDAGVLRGLLGTWQGAPDPFAREVAGAALARLYAERKEAGTRVSLLGATSWIPLVDAAVHSNEMDFRPEMFGEVAPNDVVRDDLAEWLQPSVPGTQVVAQIEDRLGDAAADTFAELLALGWPLHAAGREVGASEDWFDGWRVPYPPQDYLLDVRRNVVTVVRDAPPEAPPETVVVAIDGVRHRWTSEGDGNGVQWILDERPRRVQLDPDRHVGQVSRFGDRRPPRLRWTLWGSISEFRNTDRFVSAVGALTARREHDTHNAFRVWLWTSQRYYLGGRLSWSRYEGPLIRPSTRAHAFTIGFEAGWLDAQFATVPGAHVTVGGTLSYRWDNRRSSVFPRDGAGAFASLQMGGAPETGDLYVRARAELEGERAPHPRHVLALRAVTAAAWTDILHERGDFGGSDAVRGIPDQAVQTNLHGVVSMEYRPVVVQDAWWSLAGLAWIRDLHLVAGVDAGVGLVDDQLVAVVGGVAGLGVTTEVVGVTPGSVNFTLAWPVWWEGFALPGDASPLRFYATWGVTF